MPAFDPVRDAVLNSPTTSSPNLARRATHLSVLLNSDPVPEKLSSSQAIRRTKSPHSSPSHSPVFSSRPSSSSSSTYPQPHLTPSAIDSPLMPPPSLPKPVETIPYNPTRRSEPGSILKPMSQAEMKMYETYRDNARPDVGVEQRQGSPIIGLKNFNNWVKSVLISRFALPALQASPYMGGNVPGRGSGKILDMGCGKGGDLNKWSKARVKELLAVDVASVSVDQARARWEGMKGHRYAASFASLDCYREPLSKAFSSHQLALPFDVVSMQFCMHYAFETEEKACRMLDNVSRWLRPGGIFIGTIPNAEQLLEHLHELPSDIDELSFGNSIYRIRFDEREHHGVYGHKYCFFLKDAIEDVPEYLVIWDNFVQLASKYDLQPIYKEEFHQVFDKNQEHQDFGPLLTRMGVVDANGESAMDEDQWEAANIYVAFAFQKQ
ncbi:hypothetical protein E1B28_008630 [Marasmius oreades]|uniref:mRNA cap guanine-N(7) methyltransferase n=1 Tax=Marasmius oreades TaxID=181124 RepID=A0A9P7UTH1_9AGAR|nr:uncharacterized protein E1B28_008630 [Marasmius oreades]KAG7092266.1 hypothetical protein E1B28_008630 [Marasmius oreades]